MAAVKFSQDVISLSHIKTNPGRIIRQVDETHRPVLLTSRGRGVAVVQALSDYESAEEERQFMRAVVQGLADVAAGKEYDLDEVKQRLALK